MANLTGSIGHPHATSVVTSYSSLTPAKIDLGTRARDKAGNEFIYVDFNAARAVGEIVTWDSSFATSAVTTATFGPIGVVVGEATSSDLAGWVQIYGYCATVLANSNMTSGPVMASSATTDAYSVFIAATTDAVSNVIGFNMLTSASTATSPGFASTASSILGVCTAILNYPYIAQATASSVGV
jgi:hypothetical protein